MSLIIILNPLPRGIPIWLVKKYVMCLNWACSVVHFPFHVMMPFLYEHILSFPNKSRLLSLFREVLLWELSLVLCFLAIIYKPFFTFVSASCLLACIQQRENQMHMIITGEVSCYTQVKRTSFSLKPWEHREEPEYTGLSQYFLATSLQRAGRGLPWSYLTKGSSSSKRSVTFMELLKPHLT